MSGPRPVSGVEYFGIPVDEWRRVARLALADTQANPNDAEARQQLSYAQQILRHHAGVTGQLQTRAIRREGRNLAEQTVAEAPGAVQAYAANALHGASLGIGDELAGLAAVLPGGLSPQQAMDRYRAGRGQLYADQSIASFAGDVTGSLLLGAAGAKALPAVGATIAAGGTLTGSGVRAAGAAAALAGTEGALRGAFSEGSLAERGEQAALQGAAAAVVGGTGVGVVNRFRTRFAEKAARRELLQMRLDQARRSSSPSTIGPPAPPEVIDRIVAKRAALRAQGTTAVTLPETATPVSAPRGVQPAMIRPSDPASDAARTAHTIVMDATGDANQARAAASRAAGMAREASGVSGLDPVDRALQMQGFLNQGPNVASIDGLIRLLKTMSPQEQAGALRAFPPLWQDALKGL